MAPAHFKTELPFARTNEGIVLKTYWGNEKKEQLLLLDNHAPTWGNSIIIKDNKSIHQLKDVGYKTTTGDGNIIQGDIYQCDSIFLGDIPFKNVAFYKITANENQLKYRSCIGAIGDNVMAAGIWKIDFRKQLITIASDLDAIKNIDSANKIPAVFNDNIISVEVALSNKTNKIFEVYLGFNYTCLIPLKDFTDLYKTKNYDSSFSSLTTPAGSTSTNTLKVVEMLTIGKKEFQTPILTHSSAKKNLLGLLFFERFDFIILDYINHAFYVSKHTIL